MINNMRRILSTFLLFMILFTIGCQSSGPSVLKDQLPSHIPKNQTSSVVPLMISISKDQKGSHSLGSGVILDKHHLITARHVVHTDEDVDWLDSDLADKVALYTFIQCKKGKDHLHINTQEYEIVGGEDIPKEIEGCISCKATLLDWAVVKTDTPNWNPDDAVSIHKPALNPEWRVTPGTVLYCAGYSPAFSELSYMELLSEPTDSVELNIVVKNGETYATRSTKLHTFIKEGPYIVAGDAIESSPQEGHVQRHAFRTPNNYPSLGGHSGGGVFVWNDKTNQLELIGIISSTADVSAITKWEGSFFGILNFETHIDNDIRSNRYVPIGHILNTWDPDNN